MLDFSGWTRLTFLSLTNVNLTTLSLLSPVKSTLQSLTLIGTKVSNVDAVSDFSQLSLLTLAVSSSVSNLALPSSLVTLYLTGSANSALSTLTIPSGARIVSLEALPALSPLSLPEGIETLYLSSVSCPSGAYPLLPTTLKTLTVKREGCNFSSFDALTNLASLSIYNGASTPISVPELTLTNLNWLDMSSTLQVDENWLCALPTSLQILLLAGESNLPYFPDCFKTRTSLISLSLVMTADGGIVDSLFQNISVTSLTYFYLQGNGVWPPQVAKMSNLKWLLCTTTALLVL